MPSGSKKRKAAKKKKEQEASNPSSTHSLGEYDLKIHDEKESDGGELSSPASQEHHNHQYTETEADEEEVEKREVTSSARSFVAEDKSTNGVEVDEESIVRIDIISEPGDDSGRKDTSSSSSSSSSDDESLVVEKNIVVVEPSDQTEKPISSFSAVETQITDTDPYKEAEKSILAAIVEEKIISSPIEVTRAIDSVSPEDSGTCVVAESGSMEKWGEIYPAENQSYEDLSVAKDLKLEEREDKVVVASEKSASVTSGSTGFAVQENEDKLLVSFNAPRIDNSNVAEHVKDLEIPESSDSRPQMASVPRPVETTSWKSCCGLFEVLKGSS